MEPNQQEQGFVCCIRSSMAQVKDLPPTNAIPRVQVNIDFNNVDLGKIILPPGEDCGIKSDDEEEEAEVHDLDSGFGDVIVVDNLPKVEPKKYERLENVIRKIFGQMGTIRKQGLFMPLDEDTQKTKGYIFIGYNTPEEAQAAREQTHNYKLDKFHVFSVNTFDDFDKYMRVPPEVKPYTPTENLLLWLTGERARDQFVVRFGSEAKVYWNDARLKKPDPVYHRSFWTESFVQWSPLGTYLATIHKQGAAVWGDASTFNRLMHYMHYINRLMHLTGKEMREFKGSADDYATGGVGGVVGVSWPIHREPRGQ